MAGEYTEARQQMVFDQLVRKGIRNRHVLSAVLRVPRHMFVPPDLRVHAYDDVEMSFGDGRTLPPARLVALMLEALEPRPSARVLEIGTGTGYGTALLAEIAAEVYTMVSVLDTDADARCLLEELGYGNIRHASAEGVSGWAGAAPFAGIVVTAALPEVPGVLAEQLEEGGRLVVPVGDGSEQELYLVTREGSKRRRDRITRCRVVPLQGQGGPG